MINENITPADEWVTVHEGSERAKMCRALFYTHLANGDFKSFLRKTHPWNKSGRRLVSKTSIDAFLHKQAEAAGAL
jgi:hypothetical protein